MRKLNLGLLIGALVALPAAALADHVGEPTAPILALDLQLERYFDNLQVDCDGGVVDFDKVRIQPILDVAAVPSEHFTVRIKAEREVVSPKGIHRWQPFGIDTIWPHQNVGPHGNPGKTNIAYSNLPGERGGGTSLHGHLAYPGSWRVSVSVEGEESGTRLVEICAFTVI
jgi:hypothetical protein